MTGDSLMDRLRALAGELLVPALLLTYATDYYLEVRALPQPETNLLLIEPVYFILLGCFVLFSAGRVRATFGSDRQSTLDEFPDAGRLFSWKSLTFVAITVTYAVLMPVLGFVVTSLFYIVSLSLFLGVRSVAALSLMPLITVTLLYVGMEWWLRLPLPKGILL